MIYNLYVYDIIHTHKPPKLNQPNPPNMTRNHQVGRSIKGVKKALGSWAKAKGLEKNKRQQYGGG